MSRFATGIAALIAVSQVLPAAARDTDGRYANAPLKSWFSGNSCPLKKVAASLWGKAGRARTGLGRGGVGM